MIPDFERFVKQHSEKTCFSFIEDDGQVREFSYIGLRLHAAALAALLQNKGARRGDYISLDMANCPAFVVSIFAAAYGGFILVPLNHRLTDEEKNERLTELRLVKNARIAAHLTESKVIQMLRNVEALNPGEGRSGRFFKNKQSSERRGLSSDINSFTAREFIHFAERAAALFDEGSNALVLLTSGSSGRAKAVPLSWKNLCGAASASNVVLNVFGRGMWQAALPLFHIGGFEVIVRSVLNDTPFLLYRRVDPERLLDDAISFEVTHVSVVDKMLQDMMTADRSGKIKQYQCILLGGGATNPTTLKRASAQGARVFASYGMTETSSQIASRQVEKDFDGGVDLLPGYQVQIITPDESGFGQLAVKGPGVFNSYLNAQAAFTVDGYFLTGDTASFSRGRLTVQERISDMFISGGENIYPAEIQDKLLRVPGVCDAYAFGVEDSTWGRRPVAFVEREQNASSPQVFAESIHKSLEQRLSKLYRPRHICVMDRFPRTGIGKVDKERLKRFYQNRLEIHEVSMYRIRQKLVTPFVTAKTVMKYRESLIVEVKDWKGRTGIGECVAFPTDWYLPETLGIDEDVLAKYLIPLVLQQVYLHPYEAARCFDECEEVKMFRLAKGALEPALWDLYGKIVGKPLWKLIGGIDKNQDETSQNTVTQNSSFSGSLPSEGAEISKATGAIFSRDGEMKKTVAAEIKVPGGLVLGIMSVAKTLETVKSAVESGYTRVKLKIKPGDDIARVRAVREAFPHLVIMLDANQSYTERDVPLLRELDALNITCIEEPLDPKRLPSVGPTDFCARLARLQSSIQTPICLDESLIDPEQALEMLERSQVKHCALKIGKWGGIEPALDFYRQAQERGVVLWMGGMYETGISKTMHAAFETLPGISIPGDLSSTGRYFTTEIIKPPFEVEQGSISLNQTGFESGLGCVLDYGIIEKVLVSKRVFKKTEGAS